MELEDQQARVDELENVAYNEVIETHRELNRLELERGDLEAERDDINDRTEENAVDVFNDHMESILLILEYRNINRIWIERREKMVRDGGRKVTRSAFDLHIVRSSEDGATYEDIVNHLSESEREVTVLSTSQSILSKLTLERELPVNHLSELCSEDLLHDERWEVVAVGGVQPPTRQRCH